MLCNKWSYPILCVSCSGYLGPGGLHDGGKHPNCTGGAAGYVDAMVLGKSHVYGHPTCNVIYNGDSPYDPEGLLGALTSVLMVNKLNLIIWFDLHSITVKKEFVFP